MSDLFFTSLPQGFHVDTLTMDLVSPLHEACLGGHYACAKFLLESGANVRTRQDYFHSISKVFGGKSLMRNTPKMFGKYKCTCESCETVRGR